MLLRLAVIMEGQLCECMGLLGGSSRDEGLLVATNIGCVLRRKLRISANRCDGLVTFFLLPFILVFMALVEREFSKEEEVSLHVGLPLRLEACQGGCMGACEWTKFNSKFAEECGWPLYHLFILLVMAVVRASERGMCHD
jgi:hypothetical protein